MIPKCCKRRYEEDEMERGNDDGLPVRVPKLPVFDDTIRRLLLLVTIVTGAYYLMARWENMMKTGAYKAIPFVFCETWLFLYVIIDSYISWYPAKRVGRDLRDVLPDSAMYPTVDVSSSRSSSSSSSSSSSTY